MLDRSFDKSNLQLILWMLYLVFFPFYFFPPGSIQIADIPMLFGIISLIFKKIIVDNYIRNLYFFVLYSILLGLFYSLVYFNFEFIKLPLNYLYCLLCLLFVSKIVNDSRFLSHTIFAIVISLIIQLGVLKVTGLDEEQFRFILCFNNPNQLGLWALSLFVFLSFLMLKYIKSKKYYIFLIPSQIICLFFILLSISQAAILSSGLIILLFLINALHSKWLYIILSFIFLFFLFFNRQIEESEYRVLNNVHERIEEETNEDDGDNNLDGRNYTRLFNYPKYLFFGAGEGKVDRFPGNGLEIHSTYANVFFSYGIIGLFLYCLPLIFFIKKKSLILVIIVIFYLVFTLVHNTIRWPLFWIIPYLIYKIPFSKKNTVNE